MMDIYLSPVRILYTDIVDSFYLNSHLATTRLNDLEERGLISRRIHIKAHQTAFETPSVNLTTKEIEIHEPFMSFLWCVIYSFISMNETTQKLSQCNGAVINFNSSTVENLDEMNYLFGWGLSLRYEYSAWPTTLPSPTSNTDYSKGATILCENALKYLLYHEVAHLANNHKVYQELIKKSWEELSSDELFQLKELEVEADNYAFEMLMGAEIDEENLYHKALGCILGQISSLFVIRETYSLIQRKHTDIDTRLFNLMNKIEFEDERYQRNIDQTLNIGLSLFLHIHNVKYLPDDHKTINWNDTFNEVLKYLYERIDDEKNRYK